MAYIYHNVDTNKIEIWGESRKFDYVILQINKRYENAVNYLNNEFSFESFTPSISIYSIVTFLFPS